MNEITTAAPMVVAAAAVAARFQEGLGDLPGVTRRVLWRDGTSEAGVLYIEAGHRLGLHTHRTNHHHMWMVTGEAVVAGTVLAPGSYAHVPAGVEHDVDATATDGCTLFYVYAA